MPRQKRRSKSKKRIRTLALLIPILVIIGFALSHFYHAESINPSPRPETSNQPVTNTSSFCGVSSKSIEVPKDSYSKAHRPAAKGLDGATYVKTRAQLDELVQNRQLYKANDGLGFVISTEKLTHSYPVSVSYTHLTLPTTPYV